MLKIGDAFEARTPALPEIAECLRKGRPCTEMPADMGLPAPKMLIKRFLIGDVDEAIKSKSQLCLYSSKDKLPLGLFGSKASSKNDHA